MKLDQELAKMSGGGSVPSELAQLDRCLHRHGSLWTSLNRSMKLESVIWVKLGSGVLQVNRKYLLLSEWLEFKGHEFGERDYASRLDLIAKVGGLQKAENYIANIPKSFRGEVVYRTLLVYCVSVGNVRKAEKVFNKMKDLEFPISSYAFDQMLLLYKRGDKKKIADVLLFMERDNVKPSLFTYKILIAAKGQSKDITGMEKIIERMKDKGLKLDIGIQALLAKHYISGGLKEKTESLLQEMEGADIKENRHACQSLLSLYTALGKADEVGRILKICKSRPRLVECLAAIEVWRGDVHNTEKLFHRMRKVGYVSRNRPYLSLVLAYVNAKTLVYGFNERMKADNIIPHGALATQLDQVDPFRKTAVSDLLE
ncbi:hypothetical protein ACH5RR_003119 [Cinchona calisaya]|uniref:Pentatricopeptide repeat-containing protein n=1 Tax=Cinchona calisaya TaxID=153742 RepID=A0ABD3AU21_9GENT